MDADRRVRFLVAPVLLIASLLWGALLDQNYRQCIFNGLGNINDLSKLIGVAAAGGFAVFAFGYVVGTITYFILVVWFRLWGLRPGKSQFYEASLSNDALEQVWVTLHCGAADDRHEMNKRKQELYAVAAFDHGVLRENYRGIHLWLVRRWSAFNIGATSAVGLGLSFVLGRFNPVIRIPFQPGWWVPVGGLGVILSWSRSLRGETP